MNTIEDNQERRGRGPGKKPAKIYFPVRLNPEQYEWLQSQGGNKSEIIRNLIQSKIHEEQQA
jgi:hypothetical protein